MSSFPTDPSQRRWFANFKSTRENIPNLLAIATVIVIVSYTNCSGDDATDVHQGSQSCKSLDFEVDSLKFVHQEEGYGKLTLKLDL